MNTFENRERKRKKVIIFVILPAHFLLDVSGAVRAYMHTFEVILIIYPSRSITSK